MSQAELYQPTAQDFEGLKKMTSGELYGKLGKGRNGWEARTTLGMMDFHTFKSQGGSLICTMHKLDEIKHGQDGTVAVWDVYGQPSEILFKVDSRATRGMIEFCHKKGVLVWVDRCQREYKKEVAA